MIGLMGQCDVCLNRNWDEKGVKCKAFPFGVPEKIYNMEIDHREHVSGDNGIKFEQDPGEPEVYG